MIFSPGRSFCNVLDINGIAPFVGVNGVENFAHVELPYNMYARLFLDFTTFKL